MNFTLVLFSTDQCTIISGTDLHDEWGRCSRSRTRFISIFLRSELSYEIFRGGSRTEAHSDCIVRSIHQSSNHELAKNRLVSEIFMIPSKYVAKLEVLCAGKPNIVVYMSTPHVGSKTFLCMLVLIVPVINSRL